MRIGVVGLGNIAQKAYLPTVANMRDVVPVLCTRNIDRLKEISEKYRISETTRTIDELLSKNIDGAFVHTSTEAHSEAVQKLLNNNIPVYVDKPLSYSYMESLRLVELSETRNTILMAGFNRRFAPMYQELKGKENINTIFMQKNRTSGAKDSRIVLLDDFIHVADTLRYLLPGEIEEMDVKYHKKGGLLQSITLILSSGNCTAVGMMNRESGMNEEILEVITPGNKWIVRDLNETIHLSGGIEKSLKFGDWIPILQRRGFVQAAEHFITSIKNGSPSSPSPQDSLVTHELLERVIRLIEAD